MKKVLLAALIATTMLLSCGPKIIGQPVCRQNALFVAMVAGEVHPVRIVYGPVVGDEGNGHVQTQAYIDGRWQWLTLINGKVYQSDREEFMFALPRYQTIEEYMDTALYWMYNNRNINAKEAIK
jgi:hypothetical protein